MIINPLSLPLQVRGKGQEAPGSPRPAHHPGCGWRGPGGREPLAESPAGPETQGPAGQPAAPRPALLPPAPKEGDTGETPRRQALTPPPLQRGRPQAGAPSPLVPEQRPPSVGPCQRAAGPPASKPAGPCERLGRFMWTRAHVVKSISGGGGLAV